MSANKKYIQWIEVGWHSVLLQLHENTGQVNNTPEVIHELPQNCSEEKGKMFDFKLSNMN